jgi:hypothetical protein
MSPTSPQQKFIDHDDSAQVSRIAHTYAHLVRTIDVFLNEPGGDVRAGTQQKVRESLTVIHRALNQYGYSPKNPFLQGIVLTCEIQWHRFVL